jgi:hypothetical protein
MYFDVMSFIHLEEFAVAADCFKISETLCTVTRFFYTRAAAGI